MGAEALYCDEDCGSGWLDNEYGCQSEDADAFCKLKYCNEFAYAASYNITTASNQSGFSCHGIGDILYPPVLINNIRVHYVQNMKEAHGGGNVVSNITCMNRTGTLIVKTFEQFEFIIIRPIL